MNRFVRAICYFKHFLPPDTTIEPRSKCTSAAELAVWINNITKLANTVEENVLRFVKARKEAGIVAVVVGPVKKKRKMIVYAHFESMYKFLNTVENVTNDELDELMPLNVLDNATQAAGCPAVRFDRVSQFRK